MKTFAECVEMYTVTDRQVRDFERMSPLRNSNDRVERSQFMFGRSKLNIVRDIWKENALFAFKTEYIDKLLALIKHYMGKPMGKATKEKVCNDFRSVTGYTLYFCQPEYSRGYFRISIPDFQMIEVDVYGDINGDRAHLLVNNKFQPLTAENLYVENCPDSYTENVAERVEAIITAHKEALEAQRRYNEKAIELKTLLPNFHKSFNELREDYLP